MGTKVQRESYLSSYYSMTNLEEDSNSCSWPLCNGDKTLANGQHYNSFPPRSMADAYSGYDKDVVRKTILKHEAIFKSQVYELHHLYRVQRELMDDLRRKELKRNRIPVEASFSSSLLVSQITYEDARKWQRTSFPLENNPICARSSISGVEDNNHSPLTSRKGRNSQVGPFPSKNGYTSKDIEVLEDRPMKVRRKLIDLHLPADAYIDTEEATEIKVKTVCGASSNLPNGNLKGEAQRDSLRLGSGLRGTNGLADLNEPVKVQETNGFAYGYHRVSCNGEIQSQEQCHGRKTQSAGLSKETSLNSPHEREHLPVNYSHSEDNGSQRGWHPLGTGNYTSSQKSASLFLQPEKSPYSSHPMQVLFNNSLEPRGFSSMDPDKVDSWRERTFIDLEANTRNREIFRENHLENPSNSLAQKSVSTQGHPFLNSPEILSNNSQRIRLFGDRWLSESNSRANSSFASSIGPNQMGFDHGSSSVSKEYPSNFPSIGNNYQNGRRGYGANLENFKSHLCNDPKGWETKFVRDTNLAVALSNNSVNEAQKIGEQPGLVTWLHPQPSFKGELTNGQRDHYANNASFVGSSVNYLDDSRKSQNPVWSQSFKSVSCSNNVESRKVESSDCSANRKILGCPISDKLCSYKDEAACLKADINRVLDINLPCEPASPVSEADRLIDNRTETNVAACFRHQIDLNLSVSEDEESFTPLSVRSNVKVPMIDLEVPAVPVIEEDDVCGDKLPKKLLEKHPKSLDEPVQIAAEAIVALSSSFDRHCGADVVTCSSPADPGDILHWFVATVHFYSENLDERLSYFSRNKENVNKEESSSMEKIDYFESMTLKLVEMKEEEYMPKPMVPENLKFDETGPTFLPSQRPRRGNARRGRPRRDFQRDILPGLASLSRHEVTEDIQTFGGLMRATGYAWNSGLARRKNGSKRGRPRLVMANPNQSNTASQNTVCPSPLVPQLNNNSNHHNNIELGFEGRSITGWGNMTRRPRRQRCPPGNNRTYVPLT